MKIERAIMAVLLVVSTVGTVWAVKSNVPPMSIANSIRANNYTTASATPGTAVDLSGYTWARLVVLVGTVVESATHTIHWEGSANNSSWSDLTAANVSGDSAPSIVSNATTDSNTVTTWDYEGGYRYIRASRLSVNDATGSGLCAFVIRGGVNNISQLSDQ